MKTTFKYVSIFLFFIAAFAVEAQKDKDKFIVEKTDGYTFYYDVCRPEIVPPKDAKGNDLECIVNRVNSNEKLKEIFFSVYTPTEIEKLVHNKCIIEMISNSKGEIKSVSYYFTHPFYITDQKKLNQVSLKVSQEITIDLYIPGEVKADGYNLCAIPIFALLRK